MGITSSTSKNRKAFGYKVDIDHRCLESERSDENYGSWSEDWENIFRTIRRVSRDDSYPDAIAVEDFVPGDLVYVVWAEWSESDSYGIARNRGYDILGVFRTREEARGLERLARDPARDTEAYEPIEYMGLQYRFGAFKGYFDNLEDIHIETAHIDAS